MKLSVQTGGPEEIYGVDGTYKLIKECGFDAVDVNLDHLMLGGIIRAGGHAAVFDGMDEECLRAFQPWKDAAEKYGLENYQAHALFPGYVQVHGEEYDDYLLKALEKTIMGCAYIGCKRLVVHPFFLSYDLQLDPQTEWDLNIRRYSALIPAAKKYGVMILLENMFTHYRGKIYSAICSDITTACRYIDTLNEIAGEKRFGFCLDTGHLLLLGKDVKNAMIELGDRIEAFHVHDNDGVSDQHLAPYMGKLDWNRFIEGLREIGYKSTVSFETFNIWNCVDHELCPSLMKFIAETGRMFIQRAYEKDGKH